MPSSYMSVRHPPPPPALLPLPPRQTPSFMLGRAGGKTLEHISFPGLDPAHGTTSPALSAVEGSRLWSSGFVQRVSGRLPSVKLSLAGSPRFSEGRDLC